MPEFDDTIPPGLTCVGCHYNLTGLAWGTRCPECGFKIPAAWPTDALSESHPAFIKHTHSQLRGLIIADAVVLIGLLCLASSYAGFSNTNHLPGVRQFISLLAILGFIMVAIGGICALCCSALLAKHHRNARPTFDQPGRTGIAGSLLFFTIPLALSITIGFFFSIAGSCLIAPALVVSLASGIVLYLCHFEYAKSVIERCGHNPRWSDLQVILATSIGIAAFVFAISLMSNRAYSVVFFLAILALIAMTHLARMTDAKNHVARIITEADQPREPHHS